jgi:hypothetical protein
MPITKRFLQQAELQELKTISDFIKKRHSDPLSAEIERTIKDFARIMTDRNFHERISKLVSLLEGPLSPRPHNGSNKGEKIVKRATEQLASTQMEGLEKAIAHGYRIRNAYVHNCQKLPVNTQYFLALMNLPRLFIVAFIELHRSGKRQFEDIELHFLGEEWVHRRTKGKH